jgi:hypothetical protein
MQGQEAEEERVAAVIHSAVPALGSWKGRRTQPAPGDDAPPAHVLWRQLGERLERCLDVSIPPMAAHGPDASNCSGDQAHAAADPSPAACSAAPEALQRLARDAGTCFDALFWDIPYLLSSAAAALLERQLQIIQVQRQQQQQEEGAVAPCGHSSAGGTGIAGKHSAAGVNGSSSSTSADIATPPPSLQPCPGSASRPAAAALPSCSSACVVPVLQLLNVTCGVMATLAAQLEAHEVRGGSDLPSAHTLMVLACTGTDCADNTRYWSHIEAASAGTYFLSVAAAAVAREAGKLLVADASDGLSASSLCHDEQMDLMILLRGLADVGGKWVALIGSLYASQVPSLRGAGGALLAGLQQGGLFEACAARCWQ